MGVFLDKAGQIFQVSQFFRNGAGTSNTFANRLLHWFNLGLHVENLSCLGWHRQRQVRPARLHRSRFTHQPPSGFAVARRAADAVAN
jgi:hypothetical protein